MNPFRSGSPEYLRLLLLLGFWHLFFFVGPAQGAEPTEQETLALKGEELYRRNDYHGAIQFWEKSLRLAAERGDNQTAALLHSNIGNAFDVLSQSDQAISHFIAAAKMQTENGNPGLAARANKDAAIIYLNQNDEKSALGLFRKAAGLYKQAGDMDQEIRCRARASTILWRRENSPKSPADPAPQKKNNRSAQVIALSRKGAERFQNGDLNKARQYWEEGLALSHQLSDKLAITMFHSNLATVDTGENNFEAARTHLKKALEIQRKEKKGEMVASLLESIGATYLNQAEYPTALDYFIQAGDQYLGDGDSARVTAMASQIELILTTTDHHYQRLSQRETNALPNAWEGPGGAARAEHDTRVLINQAAAFYDSKDYGNALRSYQEAWNFAKNCRDKELQAIVLTGIGIQFQILGEYAQAAEHLKKANLIYQPPHGSELGDSVLLILAKIARETREFAAGCQYAQQALQNAQARKDLSLEADAYSAKGSIYKEGHSYPEALENYHLSLETSKKIGDVSRQAIALRGIASTYQLMGQYPLSLNNYRLSAELLKSNNDHSEAVPTLSGLGSLYFQLGDYETALGYHEKALAISQTLGHRDGQCAGLNNIGIIHLYQGDLEKAKKAFIAGINLESPDRITRETLEGNLGETYLRQGHGPRALELFKKGKHTIRLGRYHLAAEDFSSAQKVFEEQLPKSHQTRNAEILLGNLIGLGLANEGGSNPEASFKFFQDAADHLELMRSKLTPSQRGNFFAPNAFGFSRTEAFEGLARVSPAAGRGMEESFFYSESLKARLFTELSAAKYGKAETRIPPTLANRERALISLLASSRKGAEDSFEKRDQASLANFEENSRRAKHDLENFIKDLRVSNPEYAAAAYPAPLHAAEIPLNEDEVLIEFEVTEPYTKVYIIKAGRVAGSYDIQLPRPQLSALVKKYVGFFQNIDNSAALGRYEPALGLRLYNLLLKPALSATDSGGRRLVTEREKIIIIPDEALGLLPFESLVVAVPPRNEMPAGQHGPAPIGIRYVADDFDITYSQSGTALAMQRNFRKILQSRKSALIVADPIFGPSDSRARGRQIPRALETPSGIVSMGAISKTMGLGGARPGTGQEKIVGSEDTFFPRLSRTSVLAEKLQRKVFSNSSPDLLLGSAATEKKLKSLSLSDYRYLILATHGILDDKIPYLKEPALVLSQLELDDENDGFLSLTEVMGLRFNAEIVSLTACQTGVGRQVSGEGVLGLGRAFQYAGANNVLVSLWSVAEDSTTLLVERFFSYIQLGKSKREALRLARADIRKEGYEHPFYWSAFIMFGN